VVSHHLYHLQRLSILDFNLPHHLTIVATFHILRNLGSHFWKKEFTFDALQGPLDTCMTSKWRIVGAPNYLPFIRRRDYQYVSITCWVLSRVSATTQKAVTEAEASPPRLRTVPQCSQTCVSPLSTLKLITGLCLYPVPVFRRWSTNICHVNLLHVSPGLFFIVSI